MARKQGNGGVSEINAVLFSSGEERIMQMLIRSVMFVIRRAMSVLASEDAVSKQAILPVAWVGAVLMAGAVVLSMPDKAHADTCWLDPCGGKHPYFCKEIC